LTTLDETELSEEILGSRASLESNFLHIWGFASPYGKYNEEVLNLTSTQYLYHRTINPGLNNIPLAEDQVYELKAVNVTSETTVEEVKDWMIQAKNEKKWLILVFHDIDGQDENSWPAENLEEIAKFARDNDFQGIWTERPVITTFNMIT
jgi:peptidoglycan/xylan/chitin deacetylase (PgdA/CDA1 family)